MPKLFGVDIAAEINKGMGKGLLPAVLRVRTPGTRTPGQLTGGTNPTSADHPCRGFLVTKERAQRDESTGLEGGAAVERGDREVLLLGGSLPAGVEPKTGDEVDIEGQTLRIVSVKRDPAAATYICSARS